MKKFILALVALFSVTVSANAMSYEQARRQALFLTDKMAYELNLTDEQYEAAYEINLDYLLGIDTYDDLYGIYWRQRNLDLSYVLLDWQYQMFVDAAYFYRPLYWDGSFWHFTIYARYPHRDYFYFGCPHFYAVYHGGHSWRMNGGRSWYEGRWFGPRDGHRDRNNFSGMRNRYDRGEFGRGTVAHNGEFGNGGRNSNRGGQSIVRTDGQRAYGGSRNNGNNQRTTIGRPRTNNNNVIRSDRNNNSFRTTNNRATQLQQRNTNVRRGGTSVNRSGFGSSTRTTVGRPSTSGRSYSTPSRSFSPQRNNSVSRQRQSTRSYSSPSRSYSSPSRSFNSTSRSFRSSTRSSAPSRNRSNSGASRSGSKSFGGRR
jgi:hypothetical protein